MNNWQLRAGRGGVCDFRKNYDFFFKWLTNKIMSCFIISDEEPSEKTKTIKWDYAKLNLILDGQVCITDFDGKLYACIGNRGGVPNEYYIPTRFIIANPILGSKEVEIDKDGVVLYNTKIDEYMYTGTTPIFATGLFDLIEQTATLLSDNIISINCSQINARVAAFVTADSEAQAATAEETLKKIYAGKPYVALKSDMIDKININPLNASAAGQNITELVELHNYIVANFFQSIGIKSNNVMKRERLIRDEIESQDDFLQVSILEMLSSWQDGLDKVNIMYGTKFKVELNPVLIKELMQQLDAAPEPKAADGEQQAATEPEEETSTGPEEEATEPEEEAAAEPEKDEAADGEQQQAETEPEEEAAAEPEEVIETIEQQEEVVQDVVDLINDAEPEEEETEPETETEEGEKDDREQEESDTS